MNSKTISKTNYLLNDLHVSIWIWSKLNYIWSKPIKNMILGLNPWRTCRNLMVSNFVFLTTKYIRPKYLTKLYLKILSNKQIAKHILKNLNGGLWTDGWMQCLISIRKTKESSGCEVKNRYLQHWSAEKVEYYSIWFVEWHFQDFWSTILSTLQTFMNFKMWTSTYIYTPILHK